MLQKFFGVLVLPEHRNDRQQRSDDGHVRSNQFVKAIAGVMEVLLDFLS